MIVADDTSTVAPQGDVDPNTVPAWGPSSAGAAEQAPSMTMPGNVDLSNRPVVNNADGSFSTVRSMSFQDDDGSETLVPTVSPDGKILSNADAIDLYRQTGQHLGKFSDADSADKYAQQLHDAQAARYGATAAALPLAQYSQKLGDGTWQQVTRNHDGSFSFNDMATPAADQQTIYDAQSAATGGFTSPDENVPLLSGSAQGAQTAQAVMTPEARAASQGYWLKGQGTGGREMVGADNVGTPMYATSGMPRSANAAPSGRVPFGVESLIAKALHDVADKLSPVAGPVQKFLGSEIMPGVRESMSDTAPADAGQFGPSWRQGARTDAVPTTEAEQLRQAATGSPVTAMTPNSALSKTGPSVGDMVQGAMVIGSAGMGALPALARPVVMGAAGAIAAQHPGASPEEVVKNAAMWSGPDLVLPIAAGSIVGGMALKDGFDIWRSTKAAEREVGGLRAAAEKADSQIKARGGVPGEETPPVTVEASIPAAAEQGPAGIVDRPEDTVSRVGDNGRAGQDLAATPPPGSEPPEPQTVSSHKFVNQVAQGEDQGLTRDEAVAAAAKATPARQIPTPARIAKMSPTQLTKLQVQLAEGLPEETTPEFAAAFQNAKEAADARAAKMGARQPRPGLGSTAASPEVEAQAVEAYDTATAQAAAEGKAPEEAHTAGVQAANDTVGSADAPYSDATGRVDITLRRTGTAEPGGAYWLTPEGKIIGAKDADHGNLAEAVLGREPALDNTDAYHDNIDEMHKQGYVQVNTFDPKHVTVNSAEGPDLTEAQEQGVRSIVNAVNPVKDERVRARDGVVFDVGRTADGTRQAHTGITTYETAKQQAAVPSFITADNKPVTPGPEPVAPEPVQVLSASNAQGFDEGMDMLTAPTEPLAPEDVEATASHAQVTATQKFLKENPVQPETITRLQTRQARLNANAENPLQQELIQKMHELDRLIDKDATDAELEPIANRIKELQNQGFEIPSGLNNGGKWAKSVEDIIGDTPEAALARREKTAAQVGQQTADAVRVAAGKHADVAASIAEDSTQLAQTRLDDWHAAASDQSKSALAYTMKRAASAGKPYSVEDQVNMADRIEKGLFC